LIENRTSASIERTPGSGRFTLQITFPQSQFCDPDMTLSSH